YLTSLLALDPQRYPGITWLPGNQIIDAVVHAVDQERNTITIAPISPGITTTELHVVPETTFRTAEGEPASFGDVLPCTTITALGTQIEDEFKVGSVTLRVGAGASVPTACP
ncbi:MAG: hypothetical protein ACRDIB_11460, partial [Ardenticatenaceae bacterium]